MLGKQKVDFVFLTAKGAEDAKDNFYMLTGQHNDRNFEQSRRQFIQNRFIQVISKFYF